MGGVDVVVDDADDGAAGSGEGEGATRFCAMGSLSCNSSKAGANAATEANRASAAAPSLPRRITRRWLKYTEEEEGAEADDDEGEETLADMGGKESVCKHTAGAIVATTPFCAEVVDLLGICVDPCVDAPWLLALDDLGDRSSRICSETMLAMLEGRPLEREELLLLGEEELEEDDPLPDVDDKDAGGDMGAVADVGRSVLLLPAPLLTFPLALPPSFPLAVAVPEPEAFKRLLPDAEEEEEEEEEEAEGKLKFASELGSREDDNDDIPIIEPRVCMSSDVAFAASCFSKYIRC